MFYFALQRYELFSQGFFLNVFLFYVFVQNGVFYMFKNLPFCLKSLIILGIYQGFIVLLQ